MAAAFALCLRTDEVRLARSFRLRGKLFDVYIAADRDTLDRHLERPEFLGAGGDEPAVEEGRTPAETSSPDRAGGRLFDRLRMR